MTYQLGIDFGTTFTAAAVAQQGRVRVFELGNRAAVIPTVVLVRDDDEFLTGEAAERRAISEPEHVAREFKRRLGDPTPLLLGGRPYSAEQLQARILRWVLAHVSEREGGPPDLVAVTRPANWGPYKLDLFEQAVRLAGIEDALLLTEPEAAAIHYASQERVAEGALVAVYDLGGGTFDAAVLRKTADGFELQGRPEGIERLGGIDFDEAMFGHVVRALGGTLGDLDPDDSATASAVARLRQECVEAKEALSADTEATIPVVLPRVQTEVRITRTEFEALIRSPLADTIEVLRRALRSAQVEPEDLSAVLLVGGSSRIPLVAQLVTAELGRPVSVDAHPKHGVAMGAALAAAAAARTQPVDEPPAAAPPPPVVVTEPPAIEVGDPGTPEEQAAPAAPAKDDEPDLADAADHARRSLPKVPALLALALVAVLAIGGLAYAFTRPPEDPDLAAADPQTSETAAPQETETADETDPTDTPSSPRASKVPDVPKSIPYVVLKDIHVEDGRYVVTYKPNRFEPLIDSDPATRHIHFFWDSDEPETVGTQEPPATRGEWVLYDTADDGSFTFSSEEFTQANRPADATAVCGIVGTHDHQVVAPQYADELASCLKLPSGSKS